ncbi:WxL domain-containing protein [Lactiplantibacillus nangangensis]|uniref:WxL domain-containing protein n=1 Tax=Lactiplantibacillus nangangensis TaxID=2559917 RepID=A0ABW1SGY7_9LACO|nr:WxL domain-containing protein [Lactiplantibacillus nangangensis]
MKKLGFLVAIGVLSLLMPARVKAATFDSSVTNGSAGKSQATVEFTDDASQMLQLAAAPDITFPSQFADGRSRQGLQASKLTDYLTIFNNAGVSAWSVQVAASGFYNATGGELKGAQLHIAQGSMLSSNPDDNPGMLILDDILAQKVSPNATPQSIVTATNSTYREWYLYLKPSQVSLDLPETNVVAGNYSADLTWTIAATPK